MEPFSVWRHEWHKDMVIFGVGLWFKQWNRLLSEQWVPFIVPFARWWLIWKWFLPESKMAERVEVLWCHTKDGSFIGSCFSQHSKWWFFAGSYVDGTPNMATWPEVAFSALKMASFPEIMYTTTKMVARYGSFSFLQRWRHHVHAI